MASRVLIPSLAAATALMALTACGEPDASSRPEQPTNPTTEATTPRPAHSPPSPPPAAEARPASTGTDVSGMTERDCLLIVDGVTHVRGRCLVYPMGGGGFTLNVWSHGKPARSHFAVVSTNGNGPADASWNKDPDDSHAWDPLGTVTLEDGCWVNARTRICAR